MGFELKLIEGEPRDGAIALSLDDDVESEFGAGRLHAEVTSEADRSARRETGGAILRHPDAASAASTERVSPKRVEGVEWTVPCLTITDYPRFQWRGLLIDPARHFIPVKDFKHYVDAMALHKFNRLQVHFTDNIGWRIEIKKYPDLTRTRLAAGSQRRQGRFLHAGRHSRAGALRGRTPRHDRP